MWCCSTFIKQKLLQQNGRDLRIERESSQRYKGFVVRFRLKRVLYEAVKSNATAREEEVRKFPDRNIDSVKTPDG